MSKFQMKILSQYIEPIKHGQKVREYRLNDDYRQKVKIGDTLVLVSDANNYVNVIVVGINHHSNWESALKDHWIDDFHYLNKTFDETLDECKRYYEDDLVNKFGIVVYDIKPHYLDIKKARILMDTNTIIDREGYSSRNSDINRLYKWFDKLDVVKMVHPATKNELLKYENEKSILTKLTTYQTLIPKEVTDDFFKGVVNKFGDNENSIVDDNLVNQVYNGTVDYMITEDRRILKKATELYLRKQILTVNDMLTILEQKYPDFIDYDILSVKLKPFGDVSIKDTFFDSLKLDYPDFENWFNRKSEEKAYVFEHSGRVVGFLYIKVEDETEIYSSFKPVFKPKKRLKVGTFKVERSGFRLGERYLKIIFDNAQKQNVDEIYMTIFEDKRLETKQLIELVSQWGFIKQGYKSDNNELIMVKNLRNYDDSKSIKYNFPLRKDKPRFFILPIEPQYHTDLFPDFILKTEDRQRYTQNLAHRYALEKIYISGVKRVTAKAGDVVLIYRNGVRNPKKYSSVITGVTILVDVHRHNDMQTFMQTCKNKSVFKEFDLEEFYNSKNWRTVIKLINDQSFINKVTLGYLRDLKVVEPLGGPRPFHEISEEAFIKIVEKGGTPWAK